MFMLVYVTLLFPFICSSKKGVQIFNVLGIISIIIIIVLLNMYVNAKPDEEKDSNAENEIQGLKDYYTYFMVTASVGLVAHIIALVGACMYNSCLVSIAILNSLFFIANFLYWGIDTEKGTWNPNIVWPIIWNLIYIYPNGIFIREVNKGIMSPQTYERERASLFCL